MCNTDKRRGRGKRTGSWRISVDMAGLEAAVQVQQHLVVVSVLNIVLLHWTLHTKAKYDHVDANDDISTVQVSVTRSRSRKWSTDMPIGKNWAIPVTRSVSRRLATNARLHGELESLPPNTMIPPTTKFTRRLCASSVFPTQTTTESPHVARTRCWRSPFC